MNLDDLAFLRQIDPDNILGHIDGLPEQFERAWQQAQTLVVPTSFRNVRHVVISGMGGSAIGGDLVTAAIAARATIPITVLRGYDLPAWVHGQEILMVASSYSGNTEETLATYEQAAERDIQVVGITTGGKLAGRLDADGQTTWLFPDEIGHPRAAIGWSFGLLLGLASRAGWVENLEKEIDSTVANLRTQRQHYQATTAAPQNPAKRQAGQFVGRLPVIVGGGIFEPVARRWKGQFNENSKSWAVFEVLPEMNHNCVVGIEFPEAVLQKIHCVFITSSDYDHPRVALRHQLTAELFMVNGIMTDLFEPVGDNPISQMMHAIQFGDYISFYLAMAYQANPALIEPINELKRALAAH